MSVSFEVLEQQIDSILEESISNDAYLFEKRKENLEKPELVKQVIDALKHCIILKRRAILKSSVEDLGQKVWARVLLSCR